jgi:multisubunit Na+/H+ antiporter MnhG subunit
VIALALVWAGVTLVGFCAVGLVAMRTAADKLHYAGWASTIAPALVAAGVVVETGFTSIGLTAVLLAGVMLVAGSASTVAVARVARLEDAGRIEPTEAERP